MEYDARLTFFPLSTFLKVLFTGKKEAHLRIDGQLLSLLFLLQIKSFELCACDL